MLSRGSHLVSLLPTDVRHWWPIVEDVFSAYRVKEIHSEVLGHYCRSKEFRYLSLDATIKCCMGILGQESYRCSKAKRNDAPFDDETALRRILTVRGSAGAVLAMIAVASEKAETVCDALSENLPAAGLNQVECVASDNASTKLYTQLRRIMPNLQCLCLDPIHLPIVYEQPVRKLFSFSNPDTILKSPFERADSGTPLGARRQQVLCACESSCTSSSPSTKTPRQTTGASSTRVTTIAP